MKKLNENAKVTLTLGQLKRLVRESTLSRARNVSARKNTTLIRESIDSRFKEAVKMLADIVQPKLSALYPGVELIECDIDDSFPYGIDTNPMCVRTEKYGSTKILDRNYDQWAGLNLKFPEIEDFPASWTGNGLDVAVRIDDNPDEKYILFGGWAPNDPKDTEGYYEDTVHRLEDAGYDIDDLTENIRRILHDAYDEVAEYCNEDDY